MECTDENKPKPSKASEVSLSDTINIDADPYSYHTFMFPFQWKYSDTDLSVGDKNKEDITKNLLRFLDEDSYWESYQSPLFGDAKTCISWAQKEQARKDYSVYQYFNVPARKAIFGDMDETDDKEDKKGMVYNYIYNFNKNEEINQETNKKAVDHKLYSIIVRKTKDKKCGENDSVDDNSIDKSISDKDKDIKKSKVEKEVIYICYDLRIKNIALRLYDSIGIGVVIYELENYKHRSMEDVIQINEYGRRIQLAMMAPDEGVKNSVSLENKFS